MAGLENALTARSDLRIGDPAGACDEALEHLRPEGGTHTVSAGAYRFVRLTEWLWKAAPRLADRGIALADLQVCERGSSGDCDVKDGNVSSVSVGIMVDGREEVLGGGWRLASAIPDLLLRREPDKTVATVVHFAAIDGPPNGEYIESPYNDA